MTHQMIEKIEQRMLSYLDNEQRERLHNTLMQCMLEESAQEHENDTQSFLKIFLAAKRVEGCSEKTIRYYDSTIRNVLTAIGKEVKHVTTDDLRVYLDEYQKRSGEYDKEKARQSKAISKYTKRQKKLEKDMTKFFNSNAFDELKALGSDIIDATFEALESGLNIDELLKAFEKYEIGDLSEDVGLLTLWDEWVSQDLAKRLKEEKEQEDD